MTIWNPSFIAFFGVSRVQVGAQFLEPMAHRAVRCVDSTLSYVSDHPMIPVANPTESTSAKKGIRC